MDVSRLDQNDLRVDFPNAKPPATARRSALEKLAGKKIKNFFLVFFCLLMFCVQGFSQTSNFIQTGDFKTHYLEWGKGTETIVLIQGLSDTAEIWRDLAVKLAKKYRVVAPDRRGSGKSEKPAANYDSQTLAIDVERLLAALKIKKAALVGHSFGGNTALALAANSPEKIDSLILIEGGFWEKREPAPLPDCPAPASNDCLIATFIQRGINEFDAEKLYPKVRCPALLILGLPRELNKQKLSEQEAANKAFFEEAVKHVKNTAALKLKRSRAVVIKDAGHWVFVDQPRIAAREIEKFIENN